MKIKLRSAHLAAPGLLSFMVLALIPLSAAAHTGTGNVGGLISGMRHPLSGLDHIVAMVAVGLWGAFLGPPAMWLLPVVFPVVRHTTSMLTVAEL